jgi:hypothetical protein
MQEAQTTPTQKTMEEITQSVATVVKETGKLKNRLKEAMASGQPVDAVAVLVREILPIQEMLAASIHDVLMLEDEDPGYGGDEDYEDEGDPEAYGDEGDEDGDGDEEGDEGDEGYLEIDEATFEAAMVILRVHGFDIPNGDKSEPTQMLSKPEYARAAVIHLLHSAYDEEEAAAAVQQLIATYPNVPLKKELDDARAAFQAQQAQQAQGGAQAGA